MLLFTLYIVIVTKNFSVLWSVSVSKQTVLFDIFSMIVSVLNNCGCKTEITDRGKNAAGNEASSSGDTEKVQPRCWCSFRLLKILGEIVFLH